MRKTTITCDRCGKEITDDINGFPHYLNNINLNLNYWHGGSMGGEEDIDRLHYEICGDCARSLYYTLKKWFKKTEDK